MKKMYLVLFAVAMAVGLSAFTTKSEKASGQLTYQDGNGFWHNYPGDPCIGTMIPECIVPTEHDARQLYYDNDDTDPVYRNP